MHALHIKKHAQLRVCSFCFLLVVGLVGLQDKEFLLMHDPKLSAGFY